MVSVEVLLEDIENSPDGPEIGAFFDFDGTIIAGYSASKFLQEQAKRGMLSPRDLVEIMAATTHFGLGSLGFSGVMAVAARFMRGTSETSYIEFGEEVYQKQIARLIYPESRALIKAHQKKGHTVAVISSATPYQVQPAARDLDIEHVLCTHCEIEDGVFTGGIVRPTCFGPGKVTAAEMLASEQGIDLEQTFFYSDSDDDIELLERVGVPRPLNPNRKLIAIAEREGWPTSRFSSKGRPGIGAWARTIAANGSLVTSFAAGIPIWALTGSRREARNFSYSLFADTASALVGLNLDVTGEEHLWARRPAVFIFNHQSKADAIIAMRLLRRDIAGIGKKEIRNIPVIGWVLEELGGMVLIDRENSASAIEAMQPLVDAIRIEGKSITLSPEGTRTVSPKLAPFKKGAFHLAMQAGVPVVPIVIHNALDVAAKGEFVFRPATVKVEVLPPVETSNWSVASLDEHIADVRGMFLKALGQEEPRAGSPAKGRTRKKSARSPKGRLSSAAKIKTKPKAPARARSKRAGSK